MYSSPQEALVQCPLSLTVGRVLLLREETYKGQVLNCFSTPASIIVT
jgi:hypothetical protein